MTIAIRVLAIGMLLISINHSIQTYKIAKAEEDLKERLDEVIETLEQQEEEEEEDNLEDLVEFVGEDENGNGLYRIR